MNCKPGDLALYVGIKKEHHGKIVHVVGRAELTPEARARCVEGEYWEIEPPLLVNGILRKKCADVSLRPLRDPGEDAQDETLSWLPVPNHHKEAA